MKQLLHKTEIEGTEYIEIFKLEDGNFELSANVHPLDGRPEISIVLSKQGILELVEDLERVISFNETKDYRIEELLEKRKQREKNKLTFLKN